MARLGCKCGNTLSNSMCPSENVIYVMNKKRVEAALGYNPHLTLMDFITNWDELTDSKRVFISEEYDFWYCTECKRVIQCEIHIGGKALAVYKPVANEISIAFNELLRLEELIVFTNFAEDAATESDPPIKLSCFIDSLPKIRYFISDDRQFVYVYDCDAKKVSSVYQFEVSANQEAEDNEG